MTEHPFASISILDLGKKPRSQGLTSVLDKGLGPAGLADLVRTSGAWIDVVKFGWGTSRMLPAEVLKEKLAILASAGIRACTGGTMLEVAKAQNQVEAFLDSALKLGFPIVEVSNGVHPMPAREKLELIAQVRARGLVAWSEVGKKDPEEDARIPIGERLAAIRSELDAGAEKVILEGRESGTVGIFDSAGQPVRELLDRLAEEIGTEALVFETPRKEQQVWMIQNFGSAVNLANIAATDAISLATLRTGLRGDTFRDVQLSGTQVFLEMGVGGAMRARTRGGVVVLIDALRASATMVTALAIGMTSVRPVASLEDCKGDVTAGERGGRKLPTLDHSNSPSELHQCDYKGRSLVLTTTNGTECLLAASCPQTVVLVGTTLNASAVAQSALTIAQERNEPITLLMAGRNNQPCIEDELAASEIFHAMGESAHMHGSLPRSSSALEGSFFAGDSGQNLVALGYSDDVRYCAQLDTQTVVPIFIDGELVPYSA